MKNYDLIPVGSKSKQKIPHCVHGPNLQLEDLNEPIPEYRRKYVCSAVRSNECKPILNFDLIKFKDRHFRKRKNFQNRLLITLKSLEPDRKWCVDCSLLLLPDELDQHANHFIKENLTLRQLKLPTKLISANVDKKEEAQYFFSDQSLKIILKTIVKCEFSHVLCIGCPSIHEQLISRSKKLNIQSFLLDIDTRYLQFYTSKQFLCFNMANNFLFEKDKYEENLNQFLSNSSKLLIIADPPFGIMIPALADTLIRLKKKINYFKKDDSNFQMNMMLFHLYFYEKRIRTVLPELKMMDYKISYSNHKKMKQEGNSIARLFTDIEGKHILLKGLSDYKYCNQCERWVHLVSEHCLECKNCCSKDGKPSVHCAVCDKCVRETYDHCFTCEICTRKGECKCGFNSKNKLLDASDYMSDDEFNYHNDKKNDLGEELNGNDHESIQNGNKEENQNGHKNGYQNGYQNGHDEEDSKANDEEHESSEINGHQSNGNHFEHQSNDNNYEDKKFEFNRSKDDLFKGFHKRNFRDGNYSRDRNFGHNQSRDRKFNSKFDSGERRFNNRNRNFDFKDRKFNDNRKFNNDRKSNFKRFNDRKEEFGRDNRNGPTFGRGRFEEKQITKDDFNQMFFSKSKSKSSSSSNRNGFKRNSFDGGHKFNKNNHGKFKRSNDSFNDRPFKRNRFSTD